jgi:hypothetical protein
MAEIHGEFLVFDFELTDPIGPIDEDADRILNVVADFRLFVGGEVLYRDADFPVIELARALETWCEHAPDTGVGFAFESRSTVQRYALFRILHGARGWSFSSVQQELPSSVIFALDDVLAAVHEFVARVARSVQSAYGLTALSAD